MNLTCQSMFCLTMEVLPYRLVNLDINKQSKMQCVVAPALSDHYPVCLNFKIKPDRPPKSIQFKDFSETDAERFSTKVDFEFFTCSDL